MKEIYIHAWRLFRQNFFQLLFVMMVIWIPCEIAMSWLTYNFFPRDNVMITFKLERLANNLFGIIAISASNYIMREREADRAGFGIHRALCRAFLLGVDVCHAFYRRRGHDLRFAPAHSSRHLCRGPAFVVRGHHCRGGTLGLRRSAAQHAIDQRKILRVFGWIIGGGTPPVLGAFLVVLPFALVDDDSWKLDALGSVLGDIPLMFFYPVFWAIYARLRDELDSSNSAEIIPQTGGA